MRNIYIGAILFLVGVSCISCDNMLDLAPEDKIVEDKVFEKYEVAESAVAGTYHLLFDASKTDYVLTEATSPLCNYNTSASKVINDINSGQITDQDGTIKNIYAKYYVAINQANLIIDKVIELGQYDEKQRLKHIAEAKFIRAYAFHRLLAWYGDQALTNNPDKDGLVLYLKHYNGFDREKDILPRNTNDEVYTQIIKDLTEAIPDLPLVTDVETMQSRVARATKTTCQALLARVYLWKRDYVNSVIQADHVLGQKDYYLEDDLSLVFPPNPNGSAMEFSHEHIFGFPVSTNGGNWQFGGNGIVYHFNNYMYSERLTDRYEENDTRWTVLTNEVTAQDESVKYVTLKYPNKNSRDNMTLLRLSEIILTRAEALSYNEKAITQEMVDLLNKVHLRANRSSEPYKIIDFVDIGELRNRILIEREKELAFEGFTRFDFLRTGRDLKNPDLPDNKKMLPIPRHEIEISNGVVNQNEGYK